MKKSGLIIIGSAIVCLPASFSFSQSKFQIEFGGGYVINLSQNRKLGNYGNGWGVHLGGAFSLNRSIALTAGFDYQRYPFDVEPPIFELRSNKAQAQNDGRDAQVYNLLIGTRLISPGKIVSPFISVLGGVAFEQLQERFPVVMPADDGRPQFHKNFSEGWIAIGLGAALPIRSNLNWLIEGRFATSYHSNDVLPMMSSLQLKF